MPDQLKIVIDADVNDALNGFKKVQSGLADVSNSFVKAGGAVVKLETPLKVLQAQFERLQKIASLPGLSFRQLERVGELMRKTQGDIINLTRVTTQASASVSKFNATSGQSINVLGNLSRVAQDAPFGFLGIANNLNPLLESFQRLQSVAKTTGTSVLGSLGAALTGPAGIGLGLGIVSSLLVKFSDDILQSEKEVSLLTIESAKLEQQLKSLAGGFDDVKKASEFLNNLGDIVVDINFGTGNLKGGLIKLQSEVVQNLFNETDLNKRLKAIQDKFDKFSITDKLSQKARNIREQFGASNLIPEKVLSELSEKNRELIKQEAAFQNALQDLSKERTKLEQERTVLAAKIRLQNVLIREDEVRKLKELQDKQKADYEKFVNEIIGRARQFNKEFGSAFVVPILDESFFVSKTEVFKRALKELRDISKGDLKIKIPITTESSQIKETVTNDINELNKVLRSLVDTRVNVNVTTKGIDVVKKELAEIRDKTITVSVKQFGEVSLDELRDKDISISIKRDGDVKKIAEQLANLKGVEVPIVIEKQGDVKEIIKELSSLKGAIIPIKINREGDIKEIVKQLGSLKGVDINVTAKGIDLITKQLSLLKGSDVVIDVSAKGIEEVKKELSELKNKTITVSLEQLGKIDLSELKDKEIAIKITQTGDVKKIAEQLTQLKGVQIPIVVEQKGNIEKIAEELTKLKGKTIPIKIIERGNIQDIVNQLKGLKDVEVNISATQNVDDALKDVEKLIKGKEFPIVINEKGIIYQISRAVDGAIKISKTKQIIIPVSAEFEAPPQPKEGVSKEIEDSFQKGIAKEIEIPVDVKFDPGLAKESLDLLSKQLSLEKQFKIFGDAGVKQFNKIFKDLDFKSAFDPKSVEGMNKGLKEGAKLLQSMVEIATVLNQALSQGIAAAFNSVFDAILEGKNVFKALGNAVKELVVQVIKAIAQMLILKAIKSFIFPGAGSIGGGGFTLAANPSGFGLGNQIGNRAFNNTINVVVTGQVSGQNILLAGQRANNSNNRIGG